MSARPSTYTIFAHRDGSVSQPILVAVEAEAPSGRMVPFAFVTVRYEHGKVQVMVEKEIALQARDLEVTVKA